VESLIDELAAELGLDPLELRRRNALVEGDQAITGPVPTFGAVEVIEASAAHELWAKRDSLPDDEGIGVAAGFWPGGNEPAAAVCRVNTDGTMTVVTSAVDMTGVNTGFATIAAAAFGLPPEKVQVVMADTSTGPYAGASGGSKVTYTVGKAVERAAEATREKLLAAASEELEIAPGDLEVVDGVVRAVGAPDRSISVEEIAKKTLRFGGRYEPIEGHGGSAQTSQAPSVAAHIAHVRVDRETGEVQLLGYAIVQDVGRALNPALVEGQMRGGAVQAIGWALYEDGRLLSGSFLDYAIPTADRLPAIDTVIVEVPAPDGPFGAKGIGEAPVIPGPAAIANAVHAATGVRFRELPMTPPRVWAALQR
jgi:CO/xanthine dehydrogenase Mo-binding subunit